MQRRMFEAFRPMKPGYGSTMNEISRADVIEIQSLEWTIVPLKANDPNNSLLNCRIHGVKEV